MARKDEHPEQHPTQAAGQETQSDQATRHAEEQAAGQQRREEQEQRAQGEHVGEGRADRPRHQVQMLERVAEGDELGSQMGTAVLAGLAVAAIEAELLPGLLIGVGAMLVPKLVPALGGVVRPLVKTAVRVGYGVVSQAQEVIAEASEQVQDIVAEVKAEDAARHGRAHPAGGSRPAAGSAA